VFFCLPAEGEASSGAGAAEPSLGAAEPGSPEGALLAAGAAG